ncbi:Sodium/calcium exchanger protein [Dictyocaulus viviparus]|uniref:Sodium/calcium exchanger protein n=1 Tax=Dictyocaulus viviparus TaxID=29172 RepID=A0A0D8XD84_DICVI|nr:Sodium/calcium exchanger protein [Dictyocaulus viviparus]
MAFGNGAPDIFASIASVLSSPKPKAGLALGELFGAGIFVTTMVTATIILIKPFKIDIYSTLRDIFFYLIALLWILLIFLYSNRVYIWQPFGFLVLYAIYLLTVIVGHQIHRRKKKRQRGLGIKKVNSSLTKSGSVHLVIPSIHVISEAGEKLQNTPETSIEKISQSGDVPQECFRRSTIINDNKQSIIQTNTIDDSLSNDSKKEDDTTNAEILEEFVVSHNLVYTGHEARSRATSLVPPPVKIVSLRMFFYDIYEHLHPLPNEWDELDWFTRVLSVIKMPGMFLFKLTIPLNECSWSKAVSIMQAVLAPQWFLFSIQMNLVEPFSSSPGLYVYALLVSLVFVGLLVFFTSMTTQPRYYKELTSYLGFLMSLSWIYFISSEVVNVVTMFGVVLQLSHEVLGLTILAWSNSIGDLIADISVVRQGYPRMAMAAAIGGPLFNLLMGFGIPFLIAKANGRTVTVSVECVKVSRQPLIH